MKKFFLSLLLIIFFISAIGIWTYIYLFINQEQAEPNVVETIEEDEVNNDDFNNSSENQLAEVNSAVENVEITTVPLTEEIQETQEHPTEEKLLNHDGACCDEDYGGEIVQEPEDVESDPLLEKARLLNALIIPGGQSKTIELEPTLLDEGLYFWEMGNDKAQSRFVYQKENLTFLGDIAVLDGKSSESILNYTQNWSATVNSNTVQINPIGSIQPWYELQKGELFGNIYPLIIQPFLYIDSSTEPGLYYVTSTLKFHPETRDHFEGQIPGFMGYIYIQN